MASFQPTSPEGSSISAKTTSTMPSRMAALLATWWYSDMASTPSSVASLRMLSDPTPSRSARATAASRTRCLVSGIRGAGLGSVWVAISVLTVEANSWRQARVDDTVWLTTIHCMGILQRKPPPHWGHEEDRSVFRTGPPPDRGGTHGCTAFDGLGPCDGRCGRRAQDRHTPGNHHEGRRP